MGNTVAKVKETARGARTVATNRKPRHEYFIEEIYEAGIVLTGTEIKSVRGGRISLQEGFVLVKNGEAWLLNVNIAHYEQGNRFNHEERRDRKLLLNRREINALHEAATRRGYTLVPLRVYINERGRAKVEVGVARGKQLHDKRDTIAKRDSERDLQRAIKGDW
jgi:SsrA-binding protein